MCNNSITIDSRADTPQVQKVYCDIYGREIKSGEKYKLGLHGDLTCYDCVIEELEEME